MAMRQFKAESKKLLDLMINSIYTNREIFLRELISNASDACDKRYFKSLTDTSVGITKDDLKIHIQPDKDSRTLTITDNGIGMTKEELEKNLGTIARSGSLDFKTENQSDNIDIIGQFGVGFYSAFMVAKKVKLGIEFIAQFTKFCAKIMGVAAPKRSPSSPARRALTRPGSGSPPASRATP